MATARKAEDTRTRRPADDNRASRSATADTQRTELDGTALSKAERQRMLRNEFSQEALPNAPAIPGYHCCWLTMNSPYDPIHKRIRMGYTPVRAEEVPGMESFKMKSGEYEGVVTCNEMALFKIPNELYLEIMTEFHHNMPLSEEEAILARLTQGQKDSSGATLEEVEGFEDLAQNRAPQFAL